MYKFFFITRFVDFVLADVDVDLELPLHFDTGTFPSGTGLSALSNKYISIHLKHSVTEFNASSIHLSVSSSSESLSSHKV